MEPLYAAPQKLQEANRTAFRGTKKRRTEVRRRYQIAFTYFWLKSNIPIRSPIAGLLVGT